MIGERPQIALVAHQQSGAVAQLFEQLLIFSRQARLKRRTTSSVKSASAIAL